VVGESRKLGVYVDGKLKLQTRNSLKAYEAADKWMREKREVWVTPVGSFVNV